MYFMEPEDTEPVDNRDKESPELNAGFLSHRLQESLAKAVSELETALTTPASTLKSISAQMALATPTRDPLSQLSVNQAQSTVVRNSLSAHRQTVATLTAYVNTWQGQVGNDAKLIQGEFQKLVERQNVVQQWILEREQEEERKVSLRLRIGYLRGRISELQASDNDTRISNELSRENPSGFGNLENSFAETEDP